jgi:carbon monoxide dehydrogenase subunit G
MKLEQSFEVEAPLEEVWAALIDVERVAPCLPGAAITARNDDGTYDGSFSVRIGPTSASYSGKLRMREIDEDAHRATMHAQGSDRRGQGGAEATIVSTLSDLGGRTRVEVSTDYRITGRLARFGRGGMIEDISERLLRQFAQSLQGQLEGGPSASAPAPEQNAAASAPAPEQNAAASAPAPEQNEQSSTGTADGSPSAPATVAAAEPAPPPPGSPPAASAQSPAASPPPPPPANELDAGSLLRSVLVARVRRNPVAFGLAGLGLALALSAVIRRR